jgi:hypothetical protein
MIFMSTTVKHNFAYALFLGPSRNSSANCSRLLYLPTSASTRGHFRLKCRCLRKSFTLHIINQLRSYVPRTTKYIQPRTNLSTKHLAAHTPMPPFARIRSRLPCHHISAFAAFPAFRRTCSPL